MVRSNTVKDKNDFPKKGFVFNIQRFSIQDGPGIRTTVFLKGCPLRCKWCSNPESQNPYPEIMLREKRCNGCMKCVDACPRGAIALNENTVQIDRSTCDLCMACVEICPTNAIERVGEKISPEEAVEECSKDELFYRNSGGGVTLSGGEPLYQPEFTLDFLKGCKERSLSTALDTCGYSRWEVLEEVLAYTDLVLFDIKHLDPELHYKGTGVRNNLILENLERIVNSKRTRVWIRLAIIPNYNDSEQYIEELAEAMTKKGVEKISLLGYHEWGRPKYASLGREYPLENSAPPSRERLQSLQDIIECKGLQVNIGH
jgi:pyruvate formate lyase activating enzyme